jgi:hypothetical protein
MEKHLLALEASEKLGDRHSTSLEEKALDMAIQEVYESTGKKWRPWANNARSLRVGDIILLVDSDTVVPEVNELFLPLDRVLIPHASRIALEMLHAKWQNAPTLRSSNTSQASHLLLKARIAH